MSSDLFTETREPEIRAGIAQEPEENAFAWAKGQISLNDLRGLLGEIDRLRAEVAEWEASFELYHSADMRGIAMWRAEAPKERELIQPDKGELVAWLLKRLDEVEAKRDEWEQHAKDTEILAAEGTLPAELIIITQRDRMLRERNALREALLRLLPESGDTINYAFGPGELDEIRALVKDA